MKMDGKYFPQVYLEECKYKVKKIQMSRFINVELESDSESDSDSELKSDTELKLESEVQSTLNNYNFFTHRWLLFKQIFYITGEFNFAKNEYFFSRFSTIIYITNEFNFAKK